jgi:hypothetical protein
MTSRRHGADSSTAEVVEIGSDGFTLRVDDEVIVVSFAEFPWFEGASEDCVRAVTRPQPHHLRWESLDVDLTVDSLRHPDRYPLVARG